jgi:hypothetical protein
VFDTLIEKLTGTVVQEAEKTRDSMAAGFASSLRGRHVAGALPRVVPSAPTAAALLYDGPGRVMGWSLRNSAGAGGLVVNLYDGSDNTGLLVASVSIGSASAWQQSTTWFGPNGVGVSEKLTIEVLSTGGAPTLAGAVYFLRG